MIGFISSYDLFPYVLSHLVIPIILIAWLWVFNRCKLDWILKFALTITYLTLLYLCGFRRPPSYFLRYIIVFICIIIATLSCLKIRYLPIWCPKNFCGWISPGIGFACLCTLLYFCIQPINACLYKSEPVHLDFPFGNGIYIIQEGGDGRVLSTFNYHYQDARHMASGSNYSMQYAVDIEKLDGYGRTSKVPFSQDLEDYNIFNEALYSPCEGEIVSITDGYPNESLTTDSHPYNTGNTIIIKSDDIYILMGHLQMGSFTVKNGDKIKKGDLLAKIGNSGMTNRPHIHIQAMKGLSWSSEGVPILFNGWFPIKNDILIR